jgi:hypothetical protein
MKPQVIIVNDTATTEIYTSDVTPYYFSFIDPLQARNSRKSLLGLKKAYEMAITYFQHVQSSKFNGLVSERVIRRYKARLNEVETLLRIVDLVK